MGTKVEVGPHGVVELFERAVDVYQESVDNGTIVPNEIDAREIPDFARVVADIVLDNYSDRLTNGLRPALVDMLTATIRVVNRLDV